MGFIVRVHGTIYVSCIVLGEKVSDHDGGRHTHHTRTLTGNDLVLHGSVGCIEKP